MRRIDREITNIEQINQIIVSCDCCRLGFIDGQSVYVVPLNFGYRYLDGQSTFYFHCAKEGKKLDLLKENPVVGFELDTNHAVNAGAIACEYSFRFRSVIGRGSAAMVEDLAEKKEALQLVMSHYSDRSDWSFPDVQAASVAVIKLMVTDMACKEHL